MNEARRHHERLARSMARIGSHGPTDQDHDDLLRAFEDCWHLKDHIKHCISQDAGKQLERDIDDHRFPSLEIVADLANKSKHVVLTKKKRVDATITHKSIHAFDGSPSPPPTAAYTVTTRDGGVHDAHRLLERALVEWNAVLAAHGL